MPECQKKRLVIYNTFTLEALEMYVFILGYFDSMTFAFLQTNLAAWLPCEET